uniref:Uncharacterized protein n=1 Tax=Arundo donax TaxID=35708 RepID=A0A0A9CLK8_ARUDO
MCYCIRWIQNSNFWVCFPIFLQQLLPSLSSQLMQNNVKWALIGQWMFLINSNKLNAFFPGESPELGLEEALGLLRRERVTHHQLPCGRRSHRLLSLRRRLRVHLPLRPHALTRHHRAGPGPTSAEGTRNPGEGRRGSDDGGEIGNAGRGARPEP